MYVAGVRQKQFQYRIQIISLKTAKHKSKHEGNNTEDKNVLH